MSFRLLLIPFLFPAFASAASLENGTPMPALTLQDQYDTTHTIDASTRLLIFSAEREVSALVETALADQTTESLSAVGIRYVSDISAMPGMVTSMIALPKMRKRPYSMLLGRDPEETAMLPREPGKVTLITSEGGNITSVQFIGDAASLRAALGIAP
ncbi:hypothetical protein [Thiocapsa marina]|uniref:FAD/FMN-containing dehydrogenase n=1 Tax=Thiocapsa marina 5811 TaxID=768671 RepID=F9UEB2_9GAMM|nr:hypothetical protein [Thiocapsa marina]EGV17233.1 hypothetical protein ThimaDRAFT_3265 [Thiocapsa marina 5811]